MSVLVACLMKPAVFSMAYAKDVVSPTPTAVSPTPVQHRSPKKPDAVFPLSEMIPISGLAWLDENRDGKYHTGEKTFAGLTVRLYDATGTFLFAVTHTDKHGIYLFHVVPYHNYILRMDDPVDYVSGPLHSYTLTVGTHAQLAVTGQMPGYGNYPYMLITAIPRANGNASWNFGFTWPLPAMRVLTINTCGSFCLVGQQVDYVLSLFNEDDELSLLPADQVTVVAVMPNGLDVTAMAGYHWLIARQAVAGAVLIRATYTPESVLPPGASLPPIVVNGILTSDAVPYFNMAVSAQVRDSHGEMSTDSSEATIQVSSDAVLAHLSSEPAKPLFSFSSNNALLNMTGPFYPGLPDTGSDPSSPGCDG